MVFEAKSSGVTTIVRTADPSRLPMLEEAIQSIVAQHWPEIEILVMMQNPSDAFVAAAREIGQRLVTAPGRSISCIPVAIPKGVDGRATLINEGLARSSTRYFGFLDDDDVLYPAAYSSMIQALQGAASAVLAAGRCMMANATISDGRIIVNSRYEVPAWEGRNRIDLFADNFIPIHSYLVDRSRVQGGLPSFSSDAVPLEDYDFLLHLAQRNEFLILNSGPAICEYRLHGSNSIHATGAGQSAVSEKVRRAHAYINGRKRAVRMEVDFDQFAVQKLAQRQAATVGEGHGQIMRSSDKLSVARKRLRFLPRAARVLALLGFVLDRSAWKVRKAVKAVQGQRG